MAEAKNTKTTATDKSDYVSIFIPLIEGEDESQFVSVNDKDYQIAKGEPVMVPPEVAEVIFNSNEQLAKAARRARELQNNASEIK